MNQRLLMSLGRAGAISLLCLSLAACLPGNQATQDVTSAGRVKGGILGLSEAADIEVNTPKAFAGTQKVVVASFKVGFVDSKSAAVKAGGGLMGNGFGGKSTARLKLEGVDAATRQALTEQAYQEFVALLQQQGYTLVDPAGLQGFKGYEKVNRFDFPFKADNSGLLSDYGVTWYHTPASFGRAPIFLGEIQGETGGFGFSNPMAVSAEYAKAAGVKVLNVAYVVDFANTDSYGGRFTSTSSIGVGQGMTLVPGAVLGLTGGWGGTFSSETGSLRTGQPLSSALKFGSVEDATSDAYKTVQTVTNVIGVLGGVGSNISRDYVVRADAAQYRQAAADVLRQGNQAFVSKMAALR